jgi:hypothetical protein
MATAQVVQKSIRDHMIMNGTMNVCGESADDDVNFLGENI